LVGEAEEWIVGLKVTILVFFAAVGLWSLDFKRVVPTTWSPAVMLVAGGMIIFLAYEGFELIANTAKDVKDPQKILPCAYYSAIGFVIVLYVLISLVTIGNLSLSEIAAARDYALAESAKPFLGNIGFTLIAVAALLSTGSALNATLYGAARVSYIIAKEGELPEELDKKIWNRPIEGLLITSIVTLLIANLADLTSISIMGSAGFLIIFAAVNASNFRLCEKTKSRKWIPLLGAIVCCGATAVLIWQTARTTPAKLWVLAVMVGLSFGVEATFRKFEVRDRKT
jgi:amino acid transporter